MVCLAEWLHGVRRRLHTPGTPAQQEELTGVPAGAAERIGREFAESALESGGRSMIPMERAPITISIRTPFIARCWPSRRCAPRRERMGAAGHTTWAKRRCSPHHTGQQQYAMAPDWQRPARQMIATGFWYLTTDQWRYDACRAERISSPLARGDLKEMSFADTLVEATQRGWMPDTRSSTGPPWCWQTKRPPRAWPRANTSLRVGGGTPRIRHSRSRRLREPSQSALQLANKPAGFLSQGNRVFLAAHDRRR